MANDLPPDLTNPLPTFNQSGKKAVSKSGGKQVNQKTGEIYHKSSSANATEAPTSGVTQSADKIAEGALKTLTEEQLDFVTLVDMYWGTTGELLPALVGLERYGIPEEVYNECIKNPKVRAALTQRGVSFKREVGDLTNSTPTEDWRQGVLTPQQLVVANIMLDPYDTRSDRKKLQDLSISSNTYNAWLRQPEFKAYLQGRAESLIGASDHEALLALHDKVRSGDLKAIEFLMEYRGKFIRRANGSDNIGGFTAESAFQLIQSIIEIIVEEVDDADTGARIGDRIRGLITARNTADALVNGIEAQPVIIPEVATARELTPEIQALMNSGIGMDQ